MRERIRSSRWRWLALGLGVVVGAGLAFAFIGSNGSGSAAETACQAVVRAVREADGGKRSPASVLEVVRAQGPVAQAAAAKDPAEAPVATAIEDMRANMEIGRPWPSIVVLYRRCG